MWDMRRLPCKGQNILLPQGNNLFYFSKCLVNENLRLGKKSNAKMKISGQVSIDFYAIRKHGLALLKLGIPINK